MVIVSFGFEGEWLWEYWLQLYVKENAPKYGLQIIKSLSGRGGGGADFLVEFRDQKVKLEVEWIYLFYDHFDDPKYKDVKIIMCLDLLKPKGNEDLTRYPQHFVYINTTDFINWYHKKTGKESIPKIFSK